LDERFEAIVANPPLSAKWKCKDNPEFSWKFLDEQFPLDGRIRYSSAFFEQEPETYEVELGDYILDKEEEEELLLE